MAKTTIKNLVSLILEQIDTRAELEMTFPRDQYIFVENIYDYPELFQTSGAVNQPDDKIRQLQPDDKIRYLQPEPELDMVAEMAGGKPSVYPITTMEEGYLRIPANIMTRTKKSIAKMPHMPKIVSLDPETNEFVDGVAIGNEILLTPTGYEVLAFQNYGVSPKPDRQSKKTMYVILKEGWENDERVNVFLGANVRGKQYGREIDRDPQATLRTKIAEMDAIIADPNSTDDEKRTAMGEKEKLVTRLLHVQEGNSKRYAIFIAINQMFDSPAVLNHLDSVLVPEAWATPRRTEASWLVVKRHSSGAESPAIDIDFISAKDFDTVDSALNQSMEIRMELADDEQAEQRKREISKQMTRSHGDRSYGGGGWSTGQRVADLNTFTREGGKTRVYELLSKAIQEGEMTVSTESTLKLVGNVEGEEYTMTATFSGRMFDRGDNGLGRSTGPLFDPITVGLRKPFVDEHGEPYDPETFTVEQNVDFFIDGGRSSWMDIRRTGYLPTLLQSLADEIINQINPDDVLATMIQRVQNAVDQEPEEVNI